MTFVKGVSGNPTGSRRKLLKRADEIMAEQGFHPVEELLKILPELTAGKKAMILLELISYVCAKPKDMPPAEDDVAREALRRLTDKELADKAQELMPMLKAS